MYFFKESDADGYSVAKTENSCVIGWAAVGEEGVVGLGVKVIQASNPSPSLSLGTGSFNSLIDIQLPQTHNSPI